MVAIHSQPRPVDLFRFFWRELKLIGVRVYEAEDFDAAIRLTAARASPSHGSSRASRRWRRTAGVRLAEKDAAGMKYLLKCSQ